MAGSAFDRTIINPREQPLSTDINMLQSQADRTLREVLKSLLRERSSGTSDANEVLITGFFGEALKPRATNPASFAVRLPAGLGFFNNVANAPASNLGGISSVDDLCTYAPLVLNADVTFSSIPSAPAAPNSRIDIIEVNPSRLLTDASSRNILDINSGQFTPGIVQKTLSWLLDGSVGIVSAPANSTAALSYKVGVIGNPPGVPPVSPGYIQIAQILIGSSVTTIDGDVIQDLRKIVAPYNMHRVGFNVSMPTTGSPIPTLQNVVAPPGVAIAAVGTSTTNADCYVYIIAGNVSNAIVAGSALNSQTTLTTTAIDAQVVTIDSAMQAALVGANASPATKVAIGQPVIRARLLAGSPGSPQLYTGHVSFRSNSNP